jgi:hypothetical protein
VNAIDLPINGQRSRVHPDQRAAAREADPSDANEAATVAGIADEGHAAGHSTKLDLALDLPGRRRQDGDAWWSITK